MDIQLSFLQYCFRLQNPDTQKVYSKLALSRSAIFSTGKEISVICTYTSQQEQTHMKFIPDHTRSNKYKWMFLTKEIFFVYSKMFIVSLLNGFSCTHNLNFSVMPWVVVLVMSTMKFLLYFLLTKVDEILWLP